ncbi:MAG: alanine racemase [Deltaproteobacteria bacterium]
MAEIGLSALRHNYRLLRSRIPASTSIFAVVKADGYGHGAVFVARTLEEEGARMLGVATVEEGVELRRAGIRVPVVVLGGVDEPQAQEAHAHDLSSALFEAAQVGYLAREGRRSGVPFPVHIKVDTGMGRLGFLKERTREILEAVAAHREVRVEGFMTHLSSADGRDPADREFTGAQLRSFAEQVPLVRRAFGNGIAVHALNSAGILTCPEHSFDLVRPGIALYGSLPGEGIGETLGFRPVMRLVTQVVSLKELPDGHPVSYGRRYRCGGRRRIAVVPLGYADGYRRSFSNAAPMAVGGRRVPVVGRVCMDHTMIDVTGIPEVSVGTEVVVMGGEGPTADDLARIADTIPYEILVQIGRRIPRRCVD